MARILTPALAAAVVLSSTLALAQPAEYTGPKKRVAVSRFDAVGSFAAEYGGWDVGEALAAQLATELANTHRFIVLERRQLSSELREQELGLMGVTTGETAAGAGRVIGAELLVHGVVTDFERSTGGKGFQLGLGFGGATFGIGGTKETGHVAIDLRLVDAATGAVVQAHRAEAKVTERTVNTDVSAAAMTLENGGFARTALGRATREALAQAVGLVVEWMEPMPWTGRVVEADEGDVYVNAGRDADLQAGQRLIVYAVAKQLVDPVTGASLGAVERRLGEIEIERVEDRFSVARALGPLAASRGDLVRLASGGRAPAGAARGGEGLTASASHASSDTALSPSIETLRQAAQELDSANASGAAGAGLFYGPPPVPPSPFDTIGQP